MNNMSGMGEAELAIVMNKMQQQQNEMEKLPDLINASMEAVFDRFFGPKPSPATTQVGLGRGEEALLDRVEEMVKATIQSELRNHHRGSDSSAPDSVDINKKSPTTLNTPEVRRMNQIQETIKVTIQAELRNNRGTTHSASASVGNEKTCATASRITSEFRRMHRIEEMQKATIQSDLRNNKRETTDSVDNEQSSILNTPEPEVRKIPKDYLLNQKLSVLSAWQCWHLGEQRGTGTDGESGTKPYVTGPWKH
jgi:hypothetical protein